MTRKDPLEMDIEELDATYGKPKLMTTVTHVLGTVDNVNHDLITVEILTEDSKRANIRFTQEALRILFASLGDRLAIDKPKRN